MKKLITLVLLLLVSVAFAQTPAKMSYQSVIRDTKDALVTEKPVAVQISILRGSKDGEAVYIETHHVATNKNGLVSLQIGGGEIVKGSLASINWADATYFVKTATDVNDGADFDIVGVSEFLSVPYALHALTAENAFSGDYGDLIGAPTRLSEFVNDLGTPSNTASAVGVPSQVWSLFGNSNSNPLVDKLGTTDAKDFVFVTNNIERLRILANGDINLKKSLEIGEDLVVKRNVTLNTTGGQTINKGNFTVSNMSSTWLTGTADIDKSLNVDGATTLQSSLDVNNMSPTHLTGLLDVDKTLNVDLATTLQSTFLVNNGAASHMTGDLVVDGVITANGPMAVNNTLAVSGITNLNNNLNVNNGATTHLTGALNVDGATTLNNTLGVTGATTLGSTLGVTGATNLNSTLNVNNGAASHLTGALDVDTTLNVDGVTTLQSALNVNNAAATHLTGTLTVDQSATLNGALNTNGQVTINTNVSGGDGAYGAYPLRVEGSAQGVAIKLTAGTPDNSNNFITFFNSSGGAVGRIEGETTGEATSDPEFIFNNAILVAEEVKAGVNVGTSFIPVVVGGVVVSSGPCGACIAAAAADLVLASANLAGYNVFALENLGVTYQSGSADYAEWLERSNASERITAGDIVGVNGGKISKNTTNAQQFMVISTKPAMLGNMPMDGQEKNYEKVAFMGQIPVKVRGIVMSGDYILPSGKNDGTGIAVAPADIKPEQYASIVGVSWSNSLIAGGVSTINMAIGLNTNDIAALAIEQDKKIKAMDSKLADLEQRLLALENGTPVAAKTAPIAPQVPAAVPTLSRYELLASSMPAELSAAVMEEAMQYLANTYQQQGLVIANHPGLNKLFNDASYRAQIIKKSQDTYKVSYQKILESARNRN
ncbi:hypothetical protein [Flavobacterium sp.]|uniref:hypothetical protein n=1 Tax=Flavobacterium sp. TaxID=239 RepID=UPI00286CE0F7|nr:hypothetical protein [Flavobacterium sp.]